MRKRLVLSMEKVHELIMEEHEHNPIVGTAVYETREFLRKLGYSDGGSSAVLNRLERIYDWNLYRRPNLSARREIGEVIQHEFGVTRTYKTSVYLKIIAYYRRRIAKGMTKEQAIKACHEHYDPILAKEVKSEPKTENIDIFTQQVKTLSGKSKDLSNLEIEL